MSTSTAQNPRPRTPTTKPYTEVQHGPVAAAVNAFIVSMFCAAAGKLTGVPPWVALLAGVGVAASLVWAGVHRTPRPLSTRSLIYRAAAMCAAGGWLFYQLADFPPPPATGLTVLAVSWTALAAVTTVCVLAHRLPPLVRWGIPALAAAFALAMAAVFSGPVLAWIGTALATTDRLPCCSGGSFDVVLPWAGHAVLSLALITAPLAILGMSFATHERAADDEAKDVARDLAAQTDSAKKRVMRRLLCNEANEWTDQRDDDGQKIGKSPNLRIEDVTFWKNGAGEDYVVDLSGNQRGTTLARLNTLKDNLATKMNLADGCGVEMGKSDKGRGYAVVSVSRVNKLAEIVPYPELARRTILNPMPWGIIRSGAETGPVLRESSVYLWGQKGSGKTVLVQNVVLGGIQCTDALVWGIDLNGGAAFAPFLAAWEEGRTSRPVIDWVATDIREVRLMAETALAIAKDRKVFYRKMKKLANVNLMPIGNGGPNQPPPEILIIIDEGAEVLGLGGDLTTDDARAARDAMDAIMRLARDAAINIVFSGLRATADVADTAFKAGTAVRAGMRVTDGAELAFGFGDYTLDPDEIQYQGAGFIRTGHGEDIKVFKSFYLDPQRMDEAGETCTPWRPYLDERGIQVGGTVYANRWRRTARKIWDDHRPDLLDSVGGVTTTPAQPAGPPADGQQHTAVAVMDHDNGSFAGAGCAPPPDAGDGDGFAALMAAASRLRRPDVPPPAAPPTAQASTAPAAGGGEDPTGPEDDDEAKAQEEWNRRFADLVSNFDATDPNTWTSGIPLPPDAEEHANPHSRAVLERLVKLHGPAGVGWTAMHRKLVAGGDWGPPVEISPVAMGKLLKQPGTDEPESWLAPRTGRAPYVHKDTAN